MSFGFALAILFVLQVVKHMFKNALKIKDIFSPESDPALHLFASEHIVLGVMFISSNN